MKEIVHRSQGMDDFTMKQKECILGILDHCFHSDSLCILRTMHDTIQYYIMKRKKVVAFLSFVHEGKNRKGEVFPNMIYNVSVHPAYRGRGFMKCILRHLKKEIIGPLHLEVYQNNLPAIGLYQKMKFKVIRPIRILFHSSSFMMTSHCHS